MDRETGNGLLTGLFVGVAIGVGLGLLYAPRTGAETRDMLKVRAEDMKNRAGSLGNSIKEKVGSVRHSMGGDGAGEAEA
jgi:gas vesicle protein